MMHMGTMIFMDEAYSGGSSPDNVFGGIRHDTPDNYMLVIFKIQFTKRNPPGLPA
jgi:hypothetical protein